MKIWTISVNFDHFWSLCDGQHRSVGLLWEIWIEPSLPNTPMLSVWPKNHSGVVHLEKMMKIWTIFVHFDHLLSPCNGQHCSVDFCGRYELSHVPSTPLCYRFDLETTLVWYILRNWWEFERFRFILIIFEVHATDNTAQLGFCGGYRLESSLPTPLAFLHSLCGIHASPS